MKTKSRFYTLIIVPEGATKIRKITIPTWILKSVILGVGIFGLFAGVMTTNHAYVLSQISENSDLRSENRRLRQQVQVLKSKYHSLDRTMERLRTLGSRLRVITGAQDSSTQAQNETLPDANQNIPKDPKAIPEEVSNVYADLDPLDPERNNLLALYDELQSKIGKSAQEALDLEKALEEQYEQLADKKAFADALPSRKPAEGYFTSGFGIRKSPLTGRIKMHEGLDLANYPGTPIRTTAFGTVSFAGTKPGYGQTVIVDHGYGLETWYAHVRKVLVKEGQSVKRGQVVAQLGNTGRSTGPHVHYEVRVNGFPVDPITYLLED